MNKLLFTNGDLFDTDKQTIVNTVNCVGTMGAGIAKEAKARFPKMYQEYVRLCKEKQVKPGEPYIWKNPEKGGKWILNFPTKNHWRNPSRIDWIIKGLKRFLEKYEEWRITSVAFPALGCGYGGLWWIDIKPIMEDYLSQVKIPVEIYRPGLRAAEKAVMHARSELLENYGNLVQDIQLIRSVHTGRQKWTDWRQETHLGLRIVGIGQVDDQLHRLQRMLFDEYGVRIEFLVE